MGWKNRLARNWRTCGRLILNIHPIRIKTL
jgi:hypothetical protein